MPITLTGNAYNDMQTLYHNSFAKPGSVSASDVKAVQGEVDKLLNAPSSSTNAADAPLNDMAQIASEPTGGANAGKWEADIQKVFAALDTGEPGNSKTQGLGNPVGDFTYSVLNPVMAATTGSNPSAQDIPSDVQNFLAANPTLSSEAPDAYNQIKNLASMPSTTPSDRSALLAATQSAYSTLYKELGGGGSPSTGTSSPSLSSSTPSVPAGSTPSSSTGGRPWPPQGPTPPNGWNWDDVPAAAKNAWTSGSSDINFGYIQLSAGVVPAVKVGNEAWVLNNSVGPNLAAGSQVPAADLADFQPVPY